MPSIQVRDVSAKLHQRLRQGVKRWNCSMGDVVLEGLKRELNRREFIEQLEQREPVELGVSAASLLQEIRDERGDL